MSRNINKAELTKMFKESESLVVELQAELEIHKGKVKDLLASHEAFKLENAKLKKNNTKLTSDVSSLKTKLAGEVNRANQIAHRKKELEYEAKTYRSDLDKLGANSKTRLDSLVSMIESHTKEIDKYVSELKSSFFFPLSKSKRRLFSSINTVLYAIEKETSHFE